MNLKKHYKGRRILVTGGTGFIGSNLVAALIPLGADITILASSPSRIEEIEESKEKIKIVIGDIRDPKIINEIVKDKDIIFNLAAKVSHMDKGVVSYEDLDVNVRGQLTLLEALRMHNPQVKIIFTSTRMVYGENVKNPIKETHPANPTTLYGIHKLMAEKYHLAYHKKHGLQATVLRIGNPYGDRQHFSSGLYSLPGWFMHRAMNGETIEILSDGKQERDYIYIGDLVEIMLRTAATEKTNGKIYNAGSGIRATFGEMVDAIAKTVKTGKFVYAAKPQSTRNDSYTLDITLLSNDINWKPKTKLKAGLKKMHAYAKKHPKK